MINKVGLSMPVYTRNNSVGFKEAGGQPETPQQIAQMAINVDPGDPDQIDALLRNLKHVNKERLEAAAEIAEESEDGAWAAGYLQKAANVRQ